MIIFFYEIIEYDSMNLQPAQFKKKEIIIWILDKILYQLI